MATRLGTPLLSHSRKWPARSPTGVSFRLASASCSIDWGGVVRLEQRLRRLERLEAAGERRALELALQPKLTVVICAFDDHAEISFHTHPPRPAVTVAREPGELDEALLERATAQAHQMGANDVHTMTREQFAEIVRQLEEII